MTDVACFIDPRFKNSFSQNKDDTISVIVEKAVKLKEMTSLPVPPQEFSAFTPDQAQGISTSNTTVPSAATKKDKSLSSLLTKITSAKHQQMVKEGEDIPLVERVTIEVKLYLFQPPMSSDADPLALWKTYDQELPPLGKIARKWLCIPATSVPSERVFSSSGHILVPHPNKLNPRKVNIRHGMFTWFQGLPKFKKSVVSKPLNFLIIPFLR